MAAAQAALETPELLEIIITFVPAHQIHSLKSVSKYWNELIKSSQPIRKARCAKPVRWSSKEDVPTYGPNRKIELHPQINYVIGWREYGGENSLCKRFSIDGYTAAAMESCREDYATSARCTSLAMSLHCQSAYQWPCTLYLKDGVKVGDILDARAALLKTFGEFVLGPLARRQYWRTRYSEDDAEITLRVAEELDTLGSGEEQAVLHASPTSAATAGSEGEPSDCGVDLGLYVGDFAEVRASMCSRRLSEG